MLRLLGTTVVLGVVFAVVGTGAAAQVPLTDAHDRAAQPIGSAVMSDAHQRAPQAVPTIPADAHDRVQPVEPVVVAVTDTGTDWTRIAVGTLIGVALAIALIAMTIALIRRPPRGHPPLAHH
ncbi:MAG TPA: hypothetical protein VLA22_06050 [Gaiellaceae bacterium]|nr:hypothetical protein [Gaiellaceae bacterium]